MPRVVVTDFRLHHSDALVLIIRVLFCSRLSELSSHVSEALMHSLQILSRYRLKRVFSGISPALSLTLRTLSLSFLCITTSSHSTALLHFTDSFSTLRHPFLFNANLWPQPQAALFTCTTVSHFGHVFLRYIELTHSICNYHKQ